MSNYLIRDFLADDIESKYIVGELTHDIEFVFGGDVRVAGVFHDVHEVWQRRVRVHVRTNYLRPRVAVDDVEMDVHHVPG